MLLFSLTIYWHWSLKGRTNYGHKSTEFTFFDSSLLKEKILSKDHYGESNQWHEWSAIVKSNLKSILVFVKHSLGELDSALILSEPTRANVHSFKISVS